MKKQPKKKSAKQLKEAKAAGKAAAKKGISQLRADIDKGAGGGSVFTASERRRRRALADAGLSV